MLTDYRREAESLGAERALLVATSVVRDAENGEAFLGEIEWSYGFTTRLLSGDEEAGMTYAGVATGRSLDDDTLVLDVAGCPTELISAGFRRSLDIGAVRLAERLLRTDPPPLTELVDCAATVREILAAELPDDLTAGTLVGVAGTVTTIAALDMGLSVYDRERVDGSRLSFEGVDRQIARLCRAAPRRAPARPRAGARACAGDRARRDHRAARCCTASGWILDVSERDILDGAALAAAELPAPAEGEAPPCAYTCC